MALIKNSKAYDTLKFVAMILLPAIGTLYAALAGLWSLPASEQVVGTILACDTFLGVVLGISSSQYNSDDENFDGYLTSSGVNPDTGNPDVAVTFTTHPNELLSGREVRFKVGKPATP